MERRNVKAPQRKRFTRSNLLLHRRVELPLHAVVAVYALMDKLCGVDGQMVFMTNTSHRLDVVSMIVSNEYITNRTKAKSKVREIFL
jgi:hypothetical protein